MPVFQGTMRLDSDPDTSLESLLTLDEDRLTLATSGQELGAWNLDELAFSREGDALRIAVEEQTVVFTTNYVDRLTEAVGIGEPKVEGRHRERRNKAKRPARTGSRLKKRVADIPIKIRAGAALGLLVLVAAFILPSLLITVFALAGTVAVLLALTALMEPTVAARLPGPLPPQRILIIGLSLMITALIVGLVT